MKPQHARRRTGGFTGWDLLICVVTLTLLAGFLMFLKQRGPKTIKEPRITCISNLKQIGLALRMWSNDQNEKFPWNLASASTNGGTLEFNLTGDVWRHFEILSNELTTPRILACPVDTQRPRILDWQSFTNNSHLSYFVGLDADEAKPQTILSGDRNLTSPTVKPIKGVLNLTANDRLEWAKAIHNEQGNIALADGSAQQITTASLNKQLQSAFLTTTQAVHRLALPE